MKRNETPEVYPAVQQSSSNTLPTIGPIPSVVTVKEDPLRKATRQKAARRAVLKPPLYTVKESPLRRHARLEQARRHLARPPVHTVRQQNPRYARPNSRPKRTDYIVAVDGEGMGGRCPIHSVVVDRRDLTKPCVCPPGMKGAPDRHRYVYLAAADEHGETWELATPNPKTTGRLSTVECFEFLLSLPSEALIIGYFTSYDLTMMLEDVDDKVILLLVNEAFRARRKYSKGKPRVVNRPVYWNGYRLNYVNRCFTLERDLRYVDIPLSERPARVVLWDVFRFFSARFTQALRDWKVGSDEIIESIERMKEQRAFLDQLTTEKVYGYCKDECRYLATLFRKLYDMHIAVDLPLKTFYGAGSTSTSLLNRIGIKSKLGSVPEAMRGSLACSFFGGRFEISHTGYVRSPVFDYDISSAYPYQATLLPCVLHGVWRLDRQCHDLHKAKLALVHARARPVRHSDRDQRAWGGLPVRWKDGHIIFPLSCAGTWAWYPEFVAAQRLNPNLEPIEAWVFDSDCDCPHPFAELAQLYRHRLELGEDAQGIVLKLALNACYGKLVQTIGAAPFQQWVWGSSITSGTRAQLLGMVAKAKNPWSIIMLATDGVFSTEELELDEPIDTGAKDTRKPLGGWTLKPYPKGIFCARPGVYFPIDCEQDELQQIRARGLGRKVLYENVEAITEAFDNGADMVTILGNERFVGFKSAFAGIKQMVRASSVKGQIEVQKTLNTAKRHENYGQWAPYPINLKFHPLPKRVEVYSDSNRLTCHPHWGEESAPYNPAITNPDIEAMKYAEMIAGDQPDAVFGADEEYADVA